MDTLPTARASRLVTPLIVVAGALAIALAERRAPLRPMTQDEPSRTLRNLAFGAASLAVVSAVERPIVTRLARRATERRRGMAQALPAKPWAQDLLAVLLMDYTIYVWHVLTHKVPVLWRLHLVHHVDLDMDASTALRFHAADMLVSIPWRAAQVALIGTSARALRIWQSFFFLSVLFHHSNVRLSARADRGLARVLTTPRMHQTHHSATRAQTHSNWSSGLSIWDHLHGTFREDSAPPTRRMGVPAYRDAAETKLAPSLTMPFRRQRDAWAAGQGNRTANDDAI